MMESQSLEELLARFVEQHERDGTCLAPEEICHGHAELVAPLGRLIERYLAMSRQLDGSEPLSGRSSTTVVAEPLPSLDGFRMIERIGRGGMGVVYKMHDTTLNRPVAAKVIRRDSLAGAAGILAEARYLALCNDPRVVQVYECRLDADPPVIIMEYVDGFPLDEVAFSLEYRQRASILREICSAVHTAHSLGIQHRDLKPSNILLDQRLSPRILDFGLAGADPRTGHLRGTVPYLAPEQLDPDKRIDARADVYALGAILYQMLCGALPYDGADTQETVAAIKRAQPRLPVEVSAGVPEPLQAIALKAMEADPAARYPSAMEMARDIERYLDGRPVLARPSRYLTTLAERLRTHRRQIEEWTRLRIIHPHEAESLRSAYSRLDARDEDWIVESRLLTFSQIALYLGAFFLVCGSLFYFGAHRFYDAVRGVVRPFLVLGLPFLGLNTAAEYLYRRQHRAVAVAFFLAGIGLLPLFMMIVLHETNTWVVPPDTPGQIFTGGSLSNRQLQVTILLALVWSGFLALRTRTAALSSCAAALLLLLVLAILGDFGLRRWVDEVRLDLLAIHLAPLVLLYGLLGHLLERIRRPWFAKPLYLATTLLLACVLEMLAYDGRAFGYLGISMRQFQSAEVSDPLLLDTLAAMAINGLLFYAVATAAERRGSDLMKAAASGLFIISPFATLEPLAYLCKTGDYSRGLDWFYLSAALSITLLSHQRQRRSFYYAGIVNAGAALWLIADHREWFDDPRWAISVVAVGLLALLTGFVLAERERRHRQ
ncbi:MAG: protein kinase [Acidobacteria bacterium]|nr:protein kinase [Acidobacteriota bacterium]